MHIPWNPALVKYPQLVVGTKIEGWWKLPILQVGAVPLDDNRVDELHARHPTKQVMFKNIITYE